MRWRLAAAFGLVLLTAGQARAATIAVTTTADLPADGRRCVDPAVPCSLRAAVQRANELRSPGGDRIELPAGTFALTIGGAHESAAAAGDLDIHSQIAIVGAGVPRGFCISGRGPLVPPDLPVLGGCIAGDAGTLIDGRQLDRVLEVHMDGMLVLESLAITGGAAPQFPGSDLPSTGGGIRNAGFIQLDRVGVYRNSAGIGGGIHSSRGMAMFHVTVAFNESTDRSLTTSCGGGVAIDGGFAVIQFAYIAANSAVLRGGGICSSSRQPAVTPAAGQLDVYASTIANNRAQRGGGIAVTHTGSPAGAHAVRLEDTTIIGNITPSDGAGLWIDRAVAAIDDVGAVLLRTFIVNNQVLGSRFGDRFGAAHGGGLFSRTGVFAAYSVVRQNRTLLGNGGGIHITGRADRPSPLFMNRSEISFNSARGPDARFGNGGGLLAEHAIVELTNVTVSGNEAVFTGAGVRTIDTNALLDRATVVDNRASDGVAGIDATGGITTASLTLMANGLRQRNCRVPAGFTTFDFSNGRFESAFNVDDGGHWCGFLGFADLRVDPLDNYGGPTWTHRLRADSPALDRAMPSDPASGGPVVCPPERSLFAAELRPMLTAVLGDQRGVARPQNILCDAGAYEREIALPSWFSRCCFTGFLLAQLTTDAMMATSAEYHAAAKAAQEEPAAAASAEIVAAGEDLGKLLDAVSSSQDPDSAVAILDSAHPEFDEIRRQLKVMTACCSDAIALDALRRRIEFGAARAFEAFHSFAARVRQPAVAQLLDELRQHVRSAALPRGIESSLSAKLDAALGSVGRNQKEPFAAQMTAFLSEVDALEGRQLDGKQALLLRQAAQEILAAWR